MHILVMQQVRAIRLLVDHREAVTAATIVPALQVPILLSRGDYHSQKALSVCFIIPLSHGCCSPCVATSMREVWTLLTASHQNVSVMGGAGGATDGGG